MNEKLKRILPKVQKPARYVGGEYGQIMKNKELEAFLDSYAVRKEK